MKLVRANEIVPYDRPHGRKVKKLLELNFEKPMTSLTCYLGTSPEGHLDTHYHPESVEMIFFPLGGKIVVNQKLIVLSAWDAVVLEPGDIHGFEIKPEPGDGPVVHFAIKLPATPDRIAVDPNSKESAK